MHKISPRLARSLVAAGTAVACTAAVAVPAADAAVPKTGTWRGDLVPALELFPTPNPWKPPFVLTALDGRIKAVATTVRLECSEPLGITDVRVLKSWRRGRGPKVSRVNGAFQFRADGAFIQGSLSRSVAIGGASMTRGEFCHATGRFNATRRR